MREPEPMLEWLDRRQLARSEVLNAGQRPSIPAG
jgi:hypothetical protein